TILRSILFEFIEGYYNRQRLHSSLKYEFPLDFETQWFEKMPKSVNIKQ
ncbi:IS3 family transposase, partial [Arcicella sp. DC2W]